MWYFEATTAPFAAEPRRGVVCDIVNKEMWFVDPLQLNWWRYRCYCCGAGDAAVIIMVKWMFFFVWYLGGSGGGELEGGMWE